MPDLRALESTLNTAARGLSKVSAKTMFGCYALFHDGGIFGLVWKTGRIGVRLPDDASYDELMGQKGADPWMAGPMKMSSWVLVPPKVEKDPKSLAAWVKKAHAQNEGPAKDRPKKKKAPATKNAPAATVAKTKAKAAGKPTTKKTATKKPATKVAKRAR